MRVPLPYWRYELTLTRTGITAASSSLDALTKALDHETQQPIDRSAWDSSVYLILDTTATWNSGPAFLAFLDDRFPPGSPERTEPNRMVAEVRRQRID